MKKQEEKMWAIVKVVLAVALFVVFRLIGEPFGLIIIIGIGMIALIGRGIFFGKW